MRNKVTDLRKAIFNEYFPFHCIEPAVDLPALVQYIRIKVFEMHVSNIEITESLLTGSFNYKHMRSVLLCSERDNFEHVWPCKMVEALRKMEKCPHFTAE